MARPRFAWETLAAARAAGIEDLIALNWEEVEDHKAASPLAIDWNAYQQLERQGVLRVGLMRAAGLLVGYNVFFVKPTLHHRQTVWAVNDLVYLDPEARRGMAGVLLISEAERLLRAEGVRAVFYCSKLGPDLGEKRGRGSVAALLSGLGYNAYETTWLKTL
jgi:L-amino acid N-acyltransferase YncA